MQEWKNEWYLNHCCPRLTFYALFSFQCRNYLQCIYCTIFFFIFKSKKIFISGLETILPCTILKLIFMKMFNFMWTYQKLLVYLKTFRQEYPSKFAKEEDVTRWLTWATWVTPGVWERCHSFERGLISQNIIFWKKDLGQQATDIAHRDRHPIIPIIPIIQF